MSTINTLESQESSRGSVISEISGETIITGAKCTGVVLAEALSYRLIQPYTVSNGLCIANIMPTKAIPIAKSAVKILSAPMTFIKQIAGLNTQQMSVSVGPVIEEVEFRYLFQQVILKQIPKAILDKVAPNHKIDLDNMPMKVFRTLVTASAFALAHTQYYSCEAGGGLTVFMGGLLYSGIIESGGSAVLTSCLHMMWNMMVTYS